MVSEDSRMALLAEISQRYYQDNQTQQEIAAATGLNRTVVSRLLTEARERGVVEISVRYPWTSQALEDALVNTFKLKSARVLVRRTDDYAGLLRDLGLLAARYFVGILDETTRVIGISWGSALNNMIHALPQLQRPDMEVVQLIGATGSEMIRDDGPMLAQSLSRQLGCGCRYLHAPLIVENAGMRDALMQERTIRDSLERARGADVALVGIGTPDPDLYSLIRAGYLPREAAGELAAAGVVGDICAQHYDCRGQVLNLDINRRAVGIDLETLAQVPTVIGVAGDARKAAAILGALRGGHLKALITDERAAVEVLRLHQQA